MKTILFTFSNTTNVNFNNLKNVIGKDALRPVIMGIFIDVDNYCMVGTNTHILNIYPVSVVKNEGAKSIIVDPSIFNLSKYNTKVKDFSSITFNVYEDKTDVMYLEQIVYTCKNIEGIYPNYSVVIPKDKAEINEIGLNFELLKNVSDSIPYKNKVCKFNFHGASRAVVFETIDTYNPIIKGIIMPAMV